MADERATRCSRDRRSRGLGQAIADRLVADGYGVCADLNAEENRDAAAVDPAGTSTLAVELDVRSRLGPGVPRGRSALGASTVGDNAAMTVALRSSRSTLLSGTM
jgi:NAD(P)-dependent dehydrogenase (short-subunit alcohol dehydrogenase family)